MKILVIEDNESVLSMIEMFFMKENFTGKYVTDGQEGYELALHEAWDCIILDWMLPNMDGITICKKLRSHDITTPIIMLTAKDAESDQVLGLELGADDYVTKPFSPLTLMARIKAVIRRSHHANVENTSMDPQMIRINKETREVFANGKNILDFTPKEFELLSFLMEHEKQVFTREQLLEHVWGYDFFGDDRTVDVHMKRLRTKLGETASECLQTVWGVGYKFVSLPLKEQNK
ncbi:response regulator transcription factor [Pseudogracilibacillus sp. ICA-222130]|uniref:response regulator transcription factor n=1 Tax=Pseudogracilibacillus sp. ICA-222130 TaxID=3134655 RepID=UPI0030BB9E96